MPSHRPAVVFEPLERRELWCGYHPGTLEPVSPRALAAAVADATPRAGGPGAWLSGAQAPLNIGEAAAGVINGTLYVVSQSHNKTLTYNIAGNTWSSTAAAPRLVAGDHHAAEVVGNKLYLVGGLTEYQGSTAPAGRVQIYNPSNNKWLFGANLPWRGGSVSTAVIGGKIYAAGGIVGSTPGAHAGTGSTTRFARYDPAMNQWTMLPPMPVAVNHAAASTDGRRFYVFGGRGGPNVLTNGTALVQMYDPSKHRWYSSDNDPGVLASLPVARGGMGKAVFHANEFYVFGGETLNGPGATANNVFNRVDIYNPATNTWRSGTTLPTAVHGSNPVKWSDKLYLPGGGTVAGFSQSRLLQVYTPT